MTVSPKMTYSITAALKNIDVKGSTMGSRKEFKEMIEFVKEKKVKPVISQTVKGIDDLGQINELFEVIRKGSQFGKLVIEIPDPSSPKL
jgi:D-arabinose 1-dehydrogenase-like Zn-dependent alcohol dehydrogenase